MEITLTEQNFKQEVLESDLPVLVDFWATWCGPCMMLAPTLSELSEEYAGKVKIGKVNVDEQPNLAAIFRVDSIPTLFYFRNGQPVETLVGLQPKERIQALLNK